jgi:hypothetical protein
VQLLKQQHALPMQLGQLKPDARTLKLLKDALQAPLRHKADDVAQLVSPLLVAAQRCTGRRQLTMRLVYLLVSVTPSTDARTLVPPR